LCPRNGSNVCKRRYISGGEKIGQDEQNLDDRSRSVYEKLSHCAIHHVFDDDCAMDGRRPSVSVDVG